MRMINVITDTLIPLAQLPARLPSPQPGKQVAMATVYRWASSGKLETIRIGGIRYTSAEALQRFAESGPALSAPSTSPPTATRHRPGAIRRRVDVAKDRLNKLMAA